MLGDALHVRFRGRAVQRVQDAARLLACKKSKRETRSRRETLKRHSSDRGTRSERSQHSAAERGRAPTAADASSKGQRQTAATGARACARDHKRRRTFIHCEASMAELIALRCAPACVIRHRRQQHELEANDPTDPGTQGTAGRAAANNTHAPRTARAKRQSTTRMATITSQRWRPTEAHSTKHGTKPTAKTKQTKQTATWM